MARVFITGSADGLGYAAAQTLHDDGHQVVVHVRNPDRLEAVAALTDGGAQVVVGDLADADQVRDLAGQVGALGRMDAVIHNAGVMHGPSVLAVNVVAPYLLIALSQRPDRLITLSSGMHRGGRQTLDLTDGSYSDSKLLITALTLALARRWPETLVNAVDPGWVPTRMGGPSASDDLRLGSVTQAWLAVSDDADARTSGGYWYHQRRHDPAAGARDEGFQDRLLDALAEHAGVRLT